MSGRLGVDIITDAAGTGSPTFPNGITTTNVVLEAPPTTLTNGVQWYDSVNGVLLTYYNGSWVEEYQSLPGITNYDFENCGNASTTSFTYTLNCGGAI